MTQEETYDEIKPNTMKFGKVGDYIKGTLVGISETTKPDTYGKLSNIYTLKALEGSYHNIVDKAVDKEPTEVSVGEEYAWFVNKDKKIITREMGKLKFGQKLILEFTEERPSDKGNPTKIIKIKPGLINGKPAMDEEWLEENSEQYDAEAEADKAFDKLTKK